MEYSYLDESVYDVSDVRNEYVLSSYNKPPTIVKGQDPEVLFFLGAGASIPAGINGVIGLVDDFKKWLETNHKTDYLAITTDILEIICRKTNTNDYKEKVDIEKLLVIVERLENSDKDLLLDFYENKYPALSKNAGYHLISGGNKLLSAEIKRFIKTHLTDTELKTNYFEQLISLTKPVSIFSTNYDICVETFCLQNDKKYVDGFNPGWDLTEFDRSNVDVKLYKLHGSIRWYRTEEGDYESSKVRTQGIKFSLDTRQDAIPIILYPGKKLEYIEPLFDMLGEFKRQLDHARYVFVIGYSFKDEHLAKVFRYAAKKNPDLIIFLVDPNAHEIYHNMLKRHVDTDFGHGFNFEDFNNDDYDTDRPSKLKDKVICLPYGIEKVVDSLKHLYLRNLQEAEKCEAAKEIEDPGNKEIGNITRWDDCLQYYLKCEHIEQVKKILDKKMSWPTLMNINYELGGKIIVKAFLNGLLWDAEREEWRRKFREYLPVFPERLYVKINEDGFLYIKFEHLYQNPITGSTAFTFYEFLSRIYDNHLIFSNDTAYKTPDNNGLKIKATLDYLRIWKDGIKIDNYIDIRREKYEQETTHLANKISEYEENKSNDTLEEILMDIEEVEKTELSMVTPV
jgi:SIR2-like protein